MQIESRLLNQEEFKKHSKRVYSQNEEDGVIEYIFKLLNVDYNNDLFIEIGTEDGETQCNSVYLRKNGMKGYLFDNNHENKDINLFKRTITTDNLKNVLDEFGLLDKSISMFSIDVDSFDYWLFKAALSLDIKPKLFVVERNDNYGSDLGTFPNESPIRWLWKKEETGNMGQYCETESGVYRAGSGYKSLDKIANENNYIRVYSGRVNLYYIHKMYIPDGFKQPDDIWGMRIDQLRLFALQNRV